MNKNEELLGYIQLFIIFGQLFDEWLMKVILNYLLLPRVNIRLAWKNGEKSVMKNKGLLASAPGTNFIRLFCPQFKNCCNKLQCLSQAGFSSLV
jgi:hypothetical protein